MKTIRVLWTTLLIMALAHIVTAQTPITLQFPPRDLGELNKMPVSGVLYERLATQFIGRTGHPLPHGHATSPNATSRTTRGLVPAPERAPFKAASEESVISTTNIDNDSSFDVEPSIIKQTSSGASAAILVHTKFTGTPGAPFNYYYSNKSGGPYTGQLTGPTGYAAYSGDPFLAESQLDSGQSQRRVGQSGPGMDALVEPRQQFDHVDGRA